MKELSIHFMVVGNNSGKIIDRWVDDAVYTDRQVAFEVAQSVVRMIQRVYNNERLCYYRICYKGSIYKGE